MAEKPTFEKPAQTMIDDSEILSEMASVPVGGKKTITKSLKLGGSQPAQISDSEELPPLETSKGVVVSEADKQEFVRSTLGSSTFMKTYDLFGDAVRVTFKTLTVDQRGAITSQIGSEAWENDKLIASLNMMQLKDKAAINPSNMPDEDIEKTFGSMSATVYSGIMSAFREFEDICDTIFEAALSPDFWIGTGGAS